MKEKIEVKCQYCGELTLLFKVSGKFWAYCPNCKISGWSDEEKQTGIFYPFRYIYPIDIKFLHKFVRFSESKFDISSLDVITAEKVMSRFVLYKRIFSIPCFVAPNFLGSLIYFTGHRLRAKYLYYNEIGVGFGNEALRGDVSQIYILEPFDSVRLLFLAAKYDEDHLIPSIVTTIFPTITTIGKKRFKCFCAPPSRLKRNILINPTNYSVADSLPILVWARRIEADVYWYDKSDIENTTTASEFFKKVCKRERSIEKKKFIIDLLKRNKINTSCIEEATRKFYEGKRIFIPPGIILDNVDGGWFCGPEQVANFEISNVEFDVGKNQWDIVINRKGKEAKISFVAVTPFEIFRSFVSEFCKVFGEFPICKLSNNQFIDFIHAHNIVLESK